MKKIARYQFLVDIKAMRIIREYDRTGDRTLLADDGMPYCKGTRNEVLHQRWWIVEVEYDED